VLSKSLYDCNSNAIVIIFYVQEIPHLHISIYIIQNIKEKKNTFKRYLAKLLFDVCHTSHLLHDNEKNTE